VLELAEGWGRIMRTAQSVLIAFIVAASILLGLSLGNLGVSLNVSLSMWKFILATNCLSMCVGLVFQAIVIWKSDASRS
jgi:hypothetical protein